MRKLICVIAAFLYLSFSFNFTISAVNQISFDEDVEQISKKLKVAKTEYENEVEAYQKMVNQKEVIEENIKKTQETITNIQNANSDDDINRYYSKWQEAKKDIEQKESEYNTIQQKVENSLIEYNKGSFGFFEYVGATDALNALKHSKYASYTHQGDPNDATNLDNMKNSFDWIRECNNLRLREGKDPESGDNLGILKVTDYMMATAQADANYSLTNIGHAQQFSIGENLAWGYSNPFTGWYDREKNDYQSGISEFSVIGHYLNIPESVKLKNQISSKVSLQAKNEAKSSHSKCTQKVHENWKSPAFYAIIEVDKSGIGCGKNEL